MGFNELRFEDKNGDEEIYLHAQRDNNIHINHNKTQYVGHDDSHTVANNRKCVMTNLSTSSMSKRYRLMSINLNK